MIDGEKGNEADKGSSPGEKGSRSNIGPFRERKEKRIGGGGGRNIEHRSDAKCQAQRLFWG